MNGRLGLALGLGGAAVLVRRALRRSPEDLTGRTVLITGASRGLGLLLAREFAGAGCRLVICARDARQLEGARADLESRGATVLALPCDVASRTEVEQLVQAAAHAFGGVDVLVNNAGIIQGGPLGAMRHEDFEAVMAANFWGAVNTTLALLPELRRRGGRIVNITSIGGRVAVPHLLPYDCSKFALFALSQGLRAELARDGIAVTTIVPGLMRTGSPVNAFFKGQQRKEFTIFELMDSTPLSSMSAERAAARIVEATRRREGLVTLSWQARLLGLVHDLFPGATADLMGLANRLLPGPDGAGAELVRGMELATPLAPSPLTALSNRAAREFNQYGGRPRPSPEHARKAGLS